jgi:hypothetical protein
LQEARLDPPALFAGTRDADLAAGESLQPGMPRPPHVYFSAPLALLLGTQGMLLGYGVGLTAFGCEDESAGCSTGPDDFEYILAYSGLTLGAAAGAHWGGLTHQSRGSFWPTAGGAALGAVPLLFGPRDEDTNAMWIGSMLAAPAGAVIMDYLIRRPR